MTVAHHKPHLEIRLEPHSGIRRPCFFCKAESNKDTFIAAVYVDGLFTGSIACPTCQAVTHPVRAEALRSEAAYLREQADELEAMADEMFVVPRPEALRTARDAYMFEVTCLTCGGSHSAVEPCLHGRVC